MNKFCPRCKKELPVNVFGSNKLKKDGLATYCKGCTREYNKAYNIEKPNTKNSNIRWAEKNKTSVDAYLQEYLSKNPCVDCGEGDKIVLEFDHVKGNKMFNIGDRGRNNYCLETIKEEIKKCEVRCANCHRRKTHKQLGWGR